MGTGETQAMRIWIDLANSPHPLLFAPIARRLEGLGHEVIVTARDHAQTVALAKPVWPEVEVIGGESPGGRIRKAGGIAGRVRELRRWAKRRQPDLALSHNSYAQLAAARSAGVRSVTAMDYEAQPANHLAFRLADRVLLPTVFPELAARRQGAGEGKARRYDGFKEEIYLGEFEPAPALPSELGAPRTPDTPLVVARTPPSGALYHRADNPLFVEALAKVHAQGASCVVLPRSNEQREALARLGLERVVVPESAVDSRALLYEADLVLGAGGTMTREAALLGVPTLTLFAGRPSEVDLELERRGALGRLSNAAQLDSLAPRSGRPRALEALRERGRAVTGAFVDAALEPD